MNPERMRLLRKSREAEELLNDDSWGKTTHQERVAQQKGGASSSASSSAPPPPPPPPASSYSRARPAHPPSSSSRSSGTAASASAAAASNDPAAAARLRAEQIARRLESSVLGKHRRDPQQPPPSSSHSPSRGDSYGSSKRRRTKKVFVPVAENPDFNYLGLLIGPKGSTQKRLELESGAHIRVRGRGSGGSRGGSRDDEDEEMHVVITADSDEAVERAEGLVRDLLFNPEHRTKVKQDQLRNLAEIRGDADLPASLYSADAAGQSAAEFFGRSRGRSADPVGGDGETGPSKVLMVPSNTVGLIIGRGGETINRLQHQTQCRIQVASEETPAAPGMREVTITAQMPNINPESSLMYAQQEIEAITSQAAHRHGGGGGGGGSYGPGATPGNQAVMWIPDSEVGLVIGRRGETIRLLQQRSGSSIQVSEPGVVPDTVHQMQSAEEVEMHRQRNERVVIITGTEQQIEMARYEINNIVGLAQQGGRGAPSSGPAPGGANEVLIKVPHDCAGKIIGRRGETIKAIQLQTGARVNVAAQRDRDGREDRDVTISGLPAQVQAAHAEVQRIIDEYNARGGGGGGGGGAYGHRGGSSSYGSDRGYQQHVPQQQQQQGQYGGQYQAHQQQAPQQASSYDAYGSYYGAQGGAGAYAQQYQYQQYYQQQGAYGYDQQQPAAAAAAAAAQQPVAAQNGAQEAAQAQGGEAGTAAAASAAATDPNAAYQQYYASAGYDPQAYQQYYAQYYAQHPQYAAYAQQGQPQPQSQPQQGQDPSAVPPPPPPAQGQGQGAAPDASS